MTDDATLARREALALVLPWIALVVPLAFALITSLVVTPDAIERGEIVLSPPCSIKRLTGHDCPSCGLTRAFTAIGHGEFERARRYHRGAPFVYGLFVIGVLVGSACGTRAVRRYRSLARTEPLA